MPPVYSGTAQKLFAGTIRSRGTGDPHGYAKKRKQN